MIKKVLVLIMDVLLVFNGYGQNCKTVQLDSERYFINETGN